MLGAVPYSSTVILLLIDYSSKVISSLIDERLDAVLIHTVFCAQGSKRGLGSLDPG